MLLQRGFEMAKLSDIIGYLCENYPHPSELSKARLAKMVYLGDWKSALEAGRQISDVRWIFNHYGPYVDDIVKVASADRSFKVVSELNRYGDLKERIDLVQPREWISLDDSDKQWLDHVIDETKSLYWKDFIKLVYSTFPVLVSEKLEQLDLNALASRYKSEVRDRSSAAG